MAKRNPQEDRGGGVVVRERKVQDTYESEFGGLDDTPASSTGSSQPEKGP